MNKQEIKMQLIIAAGELSHDIDNENGCFDEIAKNVLRKVLNCKELLDDSSNDTLIQLDNSVEDGENLVDAVFLTEDNDVKFSMSNTDLEPYTEDFEYVSREAILMVVKEITKMCN